MTTHSPSPCPRPDRVNILGVGLSAINMQQALEQLACWINNREKVLVVLCPVYTIMLCQEQPSLRSILNNAGMVTPDGMPLVFLGRLLGHQHMGRVYGPDLIQAFAERAAKEGYTSYFYGGAQGVPEQLAEVLAKRSPDFQSVGTYSPPYRDLTPEEDEAIVQRINVANPDVVWVGLGSPKQDYWMASHRDRLNAPVLVGVGAAFNMLTGRLRQAPYWMQRTGLEWLFRLAMEPRRLWRRYVLYNPRFIVQMALQMAGLRRYPLDDNS